MMRRYISGRGSRGSLWLAVVALIAFNLWQTPQLAQTGPRIHAMLISMQCYGVVDPEPATCAATAAVNSTVRTLMHGAVQLVAAGQPLLNYGLVQARLAPHAPDIMLAAKDPDHQLDWAALLPILVHLAGVYWIFVASMRRCHDRGLTAWWVVITVVPVIGFLWWVRELGMKPGAPQANRFGTPARFRVPFQQRFVDMFSRGEHQDAPAGEVRA